MQRTYQRFYDNELHKFTVFTLLHTHVGLGYDFLLLVYSTRRFDFETKQHI